MAGHWSVAKTDKSCLEMLGLDYSYINKVSDGVLG